jgi:hypothetical protein
MLRTYYAQHAVNNIGYKILPAEAPEGYFPSRSSKIFTDQAEKDILFNPIHWAYGLSQKIDRT